MQAEQNWTIPAGSTFGYVSATNAVQGELSSAYRALFGNSHIGSPLITLDNTNPRELFSPMPSLRSQAMTLVRWLKKMRWDYVNVVVEKDDPDSLSAFKHFESTASVCISDLAFLVGVSETQQQRRHRSLKPEEESGSGNLREQNRPRWFGDNKSSSLKQTANVTLVPHFQPPAAEEICNE
jgi:hypothetical protein